jgi:hypothetical protein
MTRTMHDSFTKEWMEGILTDFGEVTIEKQIAGEVRKIDLYFCPNPSAIDELKKLGLLGRMVSKLALIEAYRNAVPPWDVRNSREKVFQVEAELEREAARTKQKLKAINRPFMWVLTPTFSEALQKKSGGQERRAWGKGIYFLAEMDRTAVIAIHQLPKTIDTLFLRLLGRGKVQSDAINELTALPLDHPYRGTTLHHISRLQINLKLRQNKSREIREIIMNLAPAYDAWLDEVEGKAITKGKNEEQITIARRMLQINLPIETIAQVTGLSIEFLQQLRSADSSS